MCIEDKFCRGHLVTIPQDMGQPKTHKVFDINGTPISMARDYTHIVSLHNASFTYASHSSLFIVQICMCVAVFALVNVLVSINGLP